MADYSASLKEDPDVAPRRKEEIPSVIPLYVISFVILSGAVIAFIEVGNNLSSKQSLIQTMQGQISTLQTNYATLASNLATANTTLSTQIINTNTKLTTAQNTLQTNINNVQSTLQGEITTANGQISTLNTEFGTLNGQVTGLTTSVGTLTTNLNTVNGSLNTLTGNFNTLQNTVSGLTTPSKFSFTSQTLAANLTVVSGTPSAGTTYAQGKKNLTVTATGYLACSTAFAFTTTTTSNSPITFYLGYTLGTGAFTSVYSSKISTSSANFGFTTVNIPVTSTNNGQSVNFQVAFSGTNLTTIDVSPLSLNAECSLFA